MIKKLAFKIVFNELKKCNLFMGHYDAKHSSDSFMNGIGTIMEYISYEVSEKTYEKFSDEFLKNILDSKKKHNKDLFLAEASGVDADVEITIYDDYLK